jgi:hypothetical protein
MTPPALLSLSLLKNKVLAGEEGEEEEEEEERVFFSLVSLVSVSV